MTSTGGTYSNGIIFGVSNIVTSAENIASNSEKITLFPNPNNGAFTLQISAEKESGERVIEIYNVMGEKVYSKQLPVTNCKLSIEQPAGIYLYRVISENGELVSEGKFIIQK